MRGSNHGLPLLGSHVPARTNPSMGTGKHTAGQWLKPALHTMRRRRSKFHAWFALHTRA